MAWELHSLNRSCNPHSIYGPVVIDGMISAPRQCPYYVSPRVFLQMQNHTQYLAHIMEHISKDCSNKLQCLHPTCKTPYPTPILVLKIWVGVGLGLGCITSDPNPNPTPTHLPVYSHRPTRRCWGAGAGHSQKVVASHCLRSGPAGVWLRTDDV
jgi:hypothetical protein